MQGTKGAEFVDGLDASKAHVIVRKGAIREVEMFSAFGTTFRDPVVQPPVAKTPAELEATTGAELEKGETLADLLHRSQVRRVYVVGVASEYCVRCTAQDAAKAAGEDGKWRTVVLREGVKGTGTAGNPERQKELEGEMRSAGVIWESLEEAGFRVDQ